MRIISWINKSVTFYPGKIKPRLETICNKINAFRHLYLRPAAIEKLNRRDKNLLQLFERPGGDRS